MAIDRYSYPFTAIVGQDQMKLALVLNAINPAIGGVLIRGEKGTGKSTAVRALAKLLPEQQVVEGCHFGCHPDDPEDWCLDCRERATLGELPEATRRMRVVELPINASEDRVVGTIDLEAALKEGSRRFEPGVLAEANRNILYVDEVNLLDDHIVDVLLDAAAMGVNVVEREGVSVVHPARFILVGTMNPEEGELRPQLLDRFGLCVDVEGIRDPDQRIEISERDSAFRAGDEAFSGHFEEADGHLAESLVAAIQAFPEAALGRGQARLISAICLEAGVHGHRADVVTEQTARALAALRGRKSPTRHDVYDAAELSLAHRARGPVRREQEDASSGEEGERQESGDEQAGRGEASQPSASDSDQQAAADQDASQAESGQQAAGSDEGVASGGASGADANPDAAELFPVRKIELPRKRAPRKQAGKRAATKSTDRRGRYVRAQTQEEGSGLAVVS